MFVLFIGIQTENCKTKYYGTLQTLAPLVVCFKLDNEFHIQLIIFLINIGTREEKDHNSVKKTKPWYDGLETVMRKIFL